jgi:O-antigen/teichoic acid export membrane protein
VVFLVPQTISQVLLVEAGKDGSSFSTQTKAALGLAGGLAVVATFAAFPLADVLPALYGTGYERAAGLIVPLVAGSIPWAVTSVCLTGARVRADGVATLVITLGFAVAVLAPTLVLVRADGVEGAAQAWLVGNGIAAVLAVGLLRARARSRSTSGAGQVDRIRAPAAEGPFPSP